MNELMETIRENRELTTKLVANLLTMKVEEQEMIVTVNGQEYTVRVSLERSISAIPRKKSA